MRSAAPQATDQHRQHTKAEPLPPPAYKKQATTNQGMLKSCIFYAWSSGYRSIPAHRMWPGQYMYTRAHVSLLAVSAGHLYHLIVVDGHWLIVKAIALCITSCWM